MPRRSQFSWLYRAVPPSVRAEMDWLLRAGTEIMRKAKVWKWVHSEFVADGGTHRIAYFGSHCNIEGLRLHLAGMTKAADMVNDTARVIASDLPFPGSLRVPRFVQLMVPLRRLPGPLLERYSDKLRRVVKHHAPSLQVRRAQSADEIRFADDHMLRPYASNRYGRVAAQLDFETIQDIAQHKDGRLDILYAGSEPVACHLGLQRIRGGKRYWSAVRFGFVPAVFSDSKRLHEINSANVHLAMQFASDHGFDFYDLGDCLGRPDDGLLHWKRRRGGHIDASQCQAWFYVRLPALGRASFLWSTPLFSGGLRGRDMTLHVGVPEDKSNKDVLQRYHSMRFGGLACVAVHHARPIDGGLLAALSQLYQDLEKPPRIISIPSR